MRTRPETSVVQPGGKSDDAAEAGILFSEEELL
jgi:hypothetical protein